MVNISTALNGILLNGGDALNGILSGGGHGDNRISKALSGTLLRFGGGGGFLSNRSEDELLNGIWIGLLGVEVLMVVGVALRGVVGAIFGSEGSSWGVRVRKGRVRKGKGKGLGLDGLVLESPSRSPSQSPYRKG